MNVEKIAETIWRAEYRRATGKERSVDWADGVADEDKELYRYVAEAILTAGPKYDHKKRGTRYTRFAVARLQTDSPCKLRDLDEMFVYLAEDGTWWVRSKKEFEDGRFEKI